MEGCLWGLEVVGYESGDLLVVAWRRCPSFIGDEDRASEIMGARRWEKVSSRVEEDLFVPVEKTVVFNE